MNKPIGRAVAKQEIERIQEVLKDSMLLIGGLAVQQYIPSRVSKDIDLVCEFDVANEILEKLYPLRDWKVEDAQNDDYRPSYKIKHKVEDKGTIIFGPKILERKPYAHIDWDYLKEFSSPFKARGSLKLDKILVPSAEALAYTKLISYLGRTGNKVKENHDLQDFINLTNHDEFSSSRFYDILRRSGAESELIKDFRGKSAKSIDIVSQSSLHSLSPLFIEMHNNVEEKTVKRNINKNVYLAAPHKNISRNLSIASVVESCGYKPVVPYEEVASRNLIEGVSDSEKIRQVCMQAIEESDIFLIDIDTYGLDTAWELGYAEGLNKTIIGYNADDSATTAERLINRREYIHNFMHGWQTLQVLEDIKQHDAVIGKRNIYICGTFGNPDIDKLRSSKLLSTASKVVFPKDYLDANGLLPNDYPLSERAETNKLFKSSDLVAVILPRYGMDASWQIGYATALGIEIVGIMLTDDGKELDKASFWDHWMHGWKSKLRAIGSDHLTILLNGLNQ